MGVASGCGCKEVYRFPHIAYPYFSCICSFLQQHPYFLFIFKLFFVLVPVLFYKHTYGRLRASNGSHMKAADIALHNKKHTQTNASCFAMDIYD